MAWLQLAGYATSAGGQIWSGLNAEDIGEARARQLRERANRRRGVAQREAQHERDMGDRVVSRAVVDIVAQGGTADDANSVRMLADLEAEKEYRAMSILAVGFDEAEGMDAEADASEAEGEARKIAGFIGAASTVMSGAGEWYSTRTPKTKKAAWKHDPSAPKGSIKNPRYYGENNFRTGWGGSR